MNNLYKWLTEFVRRAGRCLKRLFRSIPLVDRQWSKELETDLERRALFLRILNRGWLVMGILAAISLFYYTDERTSLTILILLAISTFFLVRFFNQSRRTVLAGFIFTLLVNICLFGAFLFSAFQVGFEQALSKYQYILMMMGLAIIFAGAFIHRWAPFSLAALNSTLMLYITQVLAPEVGPVLSVHILWWLVATSVWLYETSLAISLTKLQQTRINLEDQVDLRTQSLQATVAQLELTQKSLKAKNRELESFSYSVSHDLRAPLRAIAGYAEVLKDDYAETLDQEGAHILERMQENVRKMDQMIQGMLLLSSLDRHLMQWQTINLNRMAQQVGDEVRQRYPQQPVVFRVDELPPCQADASLLRQALTNLVDNAFKFSRPRNPGTITLSSQNTPQGVIYCVQDNGVGFDMQQAHRLFAPFQRLHRAEEFEGNGIGLSIVHRIVQRHNGRIWAEAAIDGGATFYFSLGEPAEGDEVISSMEEKHD